MYEPHVTLECTTSLWIAGNSVTRYRYSLSVHTSQHDLDYSGRGMHRNPNSRERVIYQQICTLPAHRTAWGYRTPNGFITAHSASDINKNKVHTTHAPDAHNPPRRHRRANESPKSQLRITGL